MGKKRPKINEVADDFFYGFDHNFKTDFENQESEFLGVFVDEKKIKLFTLALFAGVVLILSKAIFLQVFKGNYYYAQAEGNRVRVEYLKSNRGLIYDAQEQPLVANMPNFELTIVPASLPFDKKQREAKISEIAESLSLAPSELLESLNQYSPNLKQPVTVKENIDYETALKYKVELSDFPGVNIDIQTQRKYLAPKGFSHILGYVGKINQKELDDRPDYLINDYIGKSGLELSYEDVLRGQYGFREIEVDATNREKRVILERAPVSGQSLILNIDQDLQNKIYQLTRQQLAKIGKSRASVILSNPNNGAILAMISIPEYDNNLFAQGISLEDYQEYLKDPDNPLFDRSIKGEYPSGSTIKMLVAAAALEENIITDRTSFNSTGGLLVANRWWFPDWKAGGHGYTNVYKAIAESVNTFFYIIGGGYEDFNGLGLDRLIKYYKLFGLGQSTGLDLPGERSGLVPTREWKKEKKGEEWYIGDTYHLAIGQGDILVTPLQVNNYTSVFANGGILYSPKIVRAYLDQDGNQTQVPVEILNSNFITPFNLKVIKKAMRRAVTEGSARYLSSLPIEVAGKTGTAQFSSKKLPHAWFTGFAPYDNPEVTITVLIEEGGEGSAVAVPLAYDILKYYFGEYKQKAN